MARYFVAVGLLVTLALVAAALPAPASAAPQCIRESTPLADASACFDPSPRGPGAPPSDPMGCTFPDGPLGPCCPWVKYPGMNFAVLTCVKLPSAVQPVTERAEAVLFEAGAAASRLNGCYTVAGDPSGFVCVGSGGGGGTAGPPECTIQPGVITCCQYHGGVEWEGGNWVPHRWVAWCIKDTD